MKVLKYLLLLTMFVSAAACGNNEEPAPNVEASKAKENFLKATEIGAYQDGVSEFAFDKKTQQLYVAPATRVIRIQTDAGSEYVELQLSAMPTLTQAAVATVRNNVGLKTTKPGDVVLLKSENECIWLWSESTLAGYILPWITQ